MSDHWNGWACIDCTILLANGETPPDMSEGETEEWLERINARMEGTLDVSLGRVYGENGCRCDRDNSDTHTRMCEEQEFSMSRCDYCGSNLGGSRSAITGWMD